MSIYPACSPVTSIVSVVLWSHPCNGVSTFYVAQQRRSVLSVPETFETFARIDVLGDVAPFVRVDSYCGAEIPVRNDSCCGTETPICTDPCCDAEASVSEDSSRDMGTVTLQ